MDEFKKISEKRAFSVKEAAEYACVSRATVDNWLVKGILPFEELPGRGNGIYSFMRIRKSDLDNFLNRFYQNEIVTNSNTNKELHDLFLLPR